MVDVGDGCVKGDGGIVDVCGGRVGDVDVFVRELRVFVGYGIRVEYF